jgi:hypothetical protein
MLVELLLVFGSAGEHAQATDAAFVAEVPALVEMLVVNVNVSVPLLADTGPALVQVTTWDATPQVQPDEPLT